jgi:phosphonopyruvate decarboxylase
MLDTKAFGEELKKLQFSFYSGVPCSFLKNLINYAINECDYVAAANEGDAVAIASGAYLGGKKSIVLMQNSGLTNAISPLVSLNYPFQIPLLGFVSLRGETGMLDEPQHELMGIITTQLLDLIKVKWLILSDEIEEAKQQLLQADQCINHNEPFFFVVRKGTFGDELLQKQDASISLNKIKITKNKADQIPARYKALTVISDLKDRKTVLITTTGKTGRELYEIGDAVNHFYMVGSMGCASSIGLGLALTKKDLDIIVIDGDGSLLMRMGSLATNEYYNPQNLLHILFDNHAYDSTGGQKTVSQNINFMEIAAFCGYSKSIYIHNLAELKTEIEDWKKNKELTFLYMKIAKGSKESLGRPHIKPYEVKDRLQTFVKNTLPSLRKGK